MPDSTKQQRAAIEAVARQFSAAWSSDASDSHLIVGGKRIAAEIVTLKPRDASASAAKPHLRFDKVAIRLVQDVRSALDRDLPDGTTALLSVTAPIRLPSKTAALLKDKIRTLLQRRSPGGDQSNLVHGNHTRIQIVKHPRNAAPNLIGFVHNPDTDPVLLFNMTRELLELPHTVTHEPRGNRWLVVAGARDRTCFDAYRYIYSQLQRDPGYEKALIVSVDGDIGILTE